MPKLQIALLPEDGIGNDVMEAARIVLDEIQLDAEYTLGYTGWECWKNEGNPLPERTIELLKNSDCALFGANTSKPKEEAEKELDPELRGRGFSYFSPNLRLKQEFNLHMNLRLCKAYKGNPVNYRDDIDITVFRENTEDLYAGVEFYPFPVELKDPLLKLSPKMKKFGDIPGDEMAISCRINTVKAIKNIVKQAFEYAKKYSKRSVTVVEKPNVLRETGGLVIRTARKVAKEYPGIEIWETNIDAMAMWPVKNPQNYDVLVAMNLFGDIISDLAAQLVGGLGFASSANIGDNFAVFEPTHGSVPKYAGMYKTNPIAMLLTAKMMIQFLGLEDTAQRLENAIAKVIEEGRVRTYDMGASSSALDVAREVVKKLREF